MISSRLPLLFFLCFQALSTKIIKHLPGFSGPLPFYLETGYVGVDEENDVQLFYYFIESEGNPREDPVLLWLSGGPGCSSFSGLAFEIGTESGDHPALNLKGYLVGNPVTGEKIYDDARVPFLHGVGIISDELYESAIRSCGNDLQSTNYAECANVLNDVEEFFSEINENHILEPKCSFALIRTKNRRLVKEDNDELCAPPSIPDIKCRSYAYLLSYYWANNNMAREALNIQKGSTREWQRCNYDLPYTYDIPSSLKYHLNLTLKGYRALVYCGDHDAYVTFLGTQAWIRSLNFSIVDDWRSWRVSGQVAGYTKTYANNLTFATVNVCKVLVTYINLLNSHYGW